MRTTSARRALGVGWMLVGVLLGAPGPAPAAPSGEPLVGVVVATQSLDLAPQGEGRLQKVEVQLGARVVAGQVLAVLELEPLQLEANARRANLQAAEADLSRTQVLLLQARQRQERARRISAFTAAEEVEKAENDAALAASEVALAQARRAEAQVRLEQAQRVLEEARVRAPFAGRITERYQSLGSLVGRTTPLFRLVSEELRLRFALPEADAAHVRPGDTVRVLLPARGVELEGKVDSIAPEVDAASRHQKAEARLAIPEALRERVAVGLLAEVTLAPKPGTPAEAPSVRAPTPRLQVEPAGGKASPR